MKVMILTVTAGQGHNMAARAVSEELAAMGCDSKTVDLFSSFSPLLGNAVDKGYLFSVSKGAPIYSKAYQTLEHRKSGSDRISLMRTSFNFAAEQVERLLSEYRPDAILCTHVFAGIAVDILIQKGGRGALGGADTYAIVTDFAFHPYWEETQHFDGIIIPSEQLIPQGLRKGLRAEQMLPYGIPIRSCFARADGEIARSEETKRAARREIGIDENIPTVLLMGGSMGYGKPEDAVGEIDSREGNFQIVAVCGSNARAFKKISALKHSKPLLCLPSVGNVDRLMDAADLIVTKPGGLTTSEALAKGLPMVISRVIPGQEERNRDFLLANGVAACPAVQWTLGELITMLLEDPERLALMSTAALRLGKPNSTHNIAAHIVGSFGSAADR